MRSASFRISMGVCGIFLSSLIIILSPDVHMILRLLRQSRSRREKVLSKE